MSSLPDDLDALTAGAPPVADWPGLVRATVRSRRRRRAVVSAAAALSLVAVSGIGVVYAAGDGREPSTLVAATPGPTPTPTCGEEPVNPSLPVPESDGDEVNDVSLAVVVSCPVVRVGETVAIEVAAAGDLATPDLSLRAGLTFYGNIADCPALPPGGVDYPDRPGLVRERFLHTYTEAGPAVLEVRAATLCGPPGEATESIRITVLPAVPEPAYPQAPNVVSIDITVTPTRPRVGEEVTVTVVARGDKSGVRFALISFAGGKKGFQGTDFSCPPGEPVPPKQSEVRETFTHVYEESGDDAILVEVDSGCGYYQGSGTTRGVISVQPADDATSSPTPQPATS